MPSRDAARGRAHGRLGRALLLARRRGAAAGPRTAAALHLVGRLRRPARAARRARPAARWRVPRARRREPARRPRGRRALRGRLLRQEHDADHAPPRLVGRARDARHRPPSSSRRRRSTRTAAPARSASTPARPMRSTSPACSTRRAASRTGRSRPTPIPEDVPRGARRPRLRLRHLPGRLPVEPRRREAAGGGDAPAGAEPHVSLVDWLEADDEELAAALRPPVRPAQRPALPAPERTRRARQRRRRARRWPSPTPRATTRCCASTPSGRCERLRERRDCGRLRDVERWIGWVRLGAVPFAIFQVAIGQRLPAATTSSGRGSMTGDPRGRGAGRLRAQPARVVAGGAEANRARRAHLRLRDRLGLLLDLQLRAGLAHPAGHVSCRSSRPRCATGSSARSPSPPQAPR